jgi:hypothetical protein
MPGETFADHDLSIKISSSENTNVSTFDYYPPFCLADVSSKFGIGLGSRTSDVSGYNRLVSLSPRISFRGCSPLIENKLKYYSTLAVGYEMFNLSENDELPHYGDGRVYFSVEGDFQLFSRPKMSSGIGVGIDVSSKLNKSTREALDEKGYRFSSVMVYPEIKLMLFL